MKVQYGLLVSVRVHEATGKTHARAVPVINPTLAGCAKGLEILEAEKHDGCREATAEEVKEFLGCMYLLPGAVETV